MNLILTTFLTGDNGFKQHDHTGKAAPDKFELMREWYESLHKQRLHGLIVYNQLSPAFVKKHTTKNCTFYKYKPHNRPSYNDERYYAYYEYLKVREDIEYCIATDLFDVKFLGNPFDLFPGYDLVAGSEIRPSWNFMNKKIKDSRLPPFEIKTVYSGGMLGGPRTRFIEFLGMLIDCFKSVPKSVNANMAVTNYCIVTHCKDWKILTGHPLHNEFRSYKAEPPVRIKHK